MTTASTLLLAYTWSMHGDIGTGWWIVMMIGMVIFWAAVIVGVVWLARGFFNGSQGERNETPLEVLERRFAEGSISEEDYRERREVLTGRAAEQPTREPVRH